MRTHNNRAAAINNFANLCTYCSTPLSASPPPCRSLSRVQVARFGGRKLQAKKLPPSSSLTASHNSSR